MSTVKILAKGGEEFEMSSELAQKSTLLKGLMEDGGDEAVPIPNVSKACLEKIVPFLEYCRDHGDPEIEAPLISEDFNDCVKDEWFAQWIEGYSKEDVFELANAAQIMAFEGLLELATAKVAVQIKGKPISEIRAFFDVQGDFTPEEEARVAEENKFALEKC